MIVSIVAAALLCAAAGGSGDQPAQQGAPPDSMMSAPSIATTAAAPAAQPDVTQGEQQVQVRVDSDGTVHSSLKLCSEITVKPALGTLPPTRLYMQGCTPLPCVVGVTPVAGCSGGGCGSGCGPGVGSLVIASPVHTSCGSGHKGCGSLGWTYHSPAK